MWAIPEDDGEGRLTCKTFRALYVHLVTMVSGQKSKENIENEERATVLR